MTVVDLSDPRHPVVTAEHRTAGYIVSLAAPGDGRLFASTGVAGIYQWTVPVDD